MDWSAKMLGLDQRFWTSSGVGGGVIQVNHNITRRHQTETDGHLGLTLVDNRFRRSLGSSSSSAPQLPQAQC
jgi:hypothetical protein